MSNKTFLKKSNKKCNEKILKTNNDKIKLCFVIIFIALLSILRFILTSQSSICILDSTYDDWLVVSRAINLFEGNWLGKYNHLTLVKGIGIEIFLALFNFLKISFVNAQTIMYILANIYFIYAIRNIIKNKAFLIIIYVVMLFNPISFGFQTFQRVYRYNIIPFQVIFIISSYYILYENITQKKGKILPHVLIAALFLTWFRLTIESYIWLIPFVIVVTTLLIINIVKNKEKMIRRILTIFIPIIFMLLVVLGIKLINLNKYDVFSYNEILDSNFSDALKAMYSVDIHNDIELVSVSQKKMEKLYEISPTLNNIKDILNERLNVWKTYDQIRNDEVEDGWFYWAFREAVLIAGYLTPQEANEFYGAVANEINLAIEEGKVDSKMVMSNPLMSPYRKGYISKLLSTMCRAFTYVTSFEEIEILAKEMNENFDDFVVLGKCAHNENIITTNILRIINEAFKTINKYLFIISLVIYIVMSKKYIINHKKEYKNIWLITTACILSSIILIAGVSYTHISAFDSINSMYLVGCYPLMIIFIFLNIFFFIEKLITPSIGDANEKN